MLLLQALFLWLMVSAMVISGAFGFRRLFPSESPWLGFIVPPLALVALLNFIEHFVALPSLLWLSPLLFLPLIVAVRKPPVAAPQSLVLPACIFLGVFAFTFGIRCLEPNIQYTSDGISDLNMVNNFCQGQKLPPPDTWMPPYRAEWYYSLQHYAASVLKRLLNVKVGVACNVSHSLLSAFTCFAAAAAAHRLTGGRLWITLVIPLLIESAATGSSAYLQLTPAHSQMWLPSDLSGVTPPFSAERGFNPLWHVTDPYHETLRLQSPGFWTWRDEYHANSSGHFLTLFALWMLAELFFLRRTNWPWVLAVLIPVLAILGSAWALPITLLVCVGAVVIALAVGRRPATLPTTLFLLGVALIILWPAFYSTTSSPQVPAVMATKPAWRVPFPEFVVQWWPIILLWVAAACSMRRITPGLRWVLIVIPVMLIGIELVTIESRYNTVEKMWGYTYGLGLIAFFPVVASRPTWPFRIVTVIMLLSACFSFWGFFSETVWWAPKEDRLHLEGDHYLVDDEQKRRLLEVVAQTRRTTFLTGKTTWCYNECPALTSFTENKSYSAWSYFESLTNYAEEAQSRETLANNFYAGTMPDRLHFLQANHISGVIVWPGDAIGKDTLAGLARDLAPSYDYLDCKGSGENNAGVFLLR